MTSALFLNVSCLAYNIKTERSLSRCNQSITDNLTHMNSIELTPQQMDTKLNITV